MKKNNRSYFTLRRPSTDFTMLVDKGVATLAGKVSYKDNVMLEKFVQKLNGVHTISNQLAIEQDISSIDLEITAIAKQKIAADKFLPAKKPNVVVIDGNATLTGEVNWWYQKQKAERDIRNIPGILSIHNHIKVNPIVNKISVSELKNKINHKLEHSKLSQGVTVDINGTEVTLRGQTTTFNAIKKITALTSSIAGVTSVTNLISIAEATSTFMK